MSIETPDLSGNYERLIDVKGRLAVPAKMRVELGGSCVVGASAQAGGEQHLNLIPQRSGWRELAGELLTADMPDERRRRLRTRDLATLVSVRFSIIEVDGQGRILLPLALRAYANLTHSNAEQPTSVKAVVSGMGVYGQVWNPELWSSYYSRL